jgi:hypothetical protein
MKMLPPAICQYITLQSSIPQDSNFDNHHQTNSRAHINVKLKYNAVTLNYSKRAKEAFSFIDLLKHRRNLVYMGQ